MATTIRYSWLLLFLVLLASLTPVYAQERASTAFVDPDEVVDTFRLSPAYPNPFNPSTQFTLRLAETQDVRIAVYNLLGHHIETLYEGRLVGEQVHRFSFEAPSNIPSGIYLIRAASEQATATQRVTLLK